MVPIAAIIATIALVTTMSSFSNTIEDQRKKAGFIFSEEVAPGLRIDMELKNILCTTESDYQKIDVIETYFGKTLVTDGKTQSAQFDEFVYHESLVHPSLMKSGLLSGKDNVPKSVFIGGGGELATARECLRHRSVERVLMVDLDEKVIDVCRKYLPEWGGETVMNDPRFELVIGDAHSYLNNCKETFDAIIMDISDPIEAGPGIMLYTKEFYQHAQSLLNFPNGVFVTQAGAAEPVPPAHATEGAQDTSCFGPIQNTLKEVFDCVVPYSVNIPSFGGDWGFVMAFQATNGNASLLERDWRMPKDGLVDEEIEKRVENKRAAGQDSLLHYDGISHLSMCALSKPLRKLLKEDKRVMTKDNPVFMY